MMDALRLLDDAEIARAYGFTPREIRYVLWHVDPKRTFTPTDTTIAGFLTELHDGLADIQKKPTAIDINGDVTKAYFAKIFGPSGTALVTQAMGIVDGTAMSGASGFITSNFASFMNPGDAIAKLVGPGPLATAAERFAYMQPIVQIFVDRQTRVIDRLASTFSLTNTAADAVARTYVHARTSGGAVDATKSALTLLSGLDGVATPITFGLVTAPYWYTFLHLHKVGTVVSRLKLADADLDWTFNHGPVALDALPLVATTSTTAFAAWSRLVQAAKLRDAFVEKKLFDIFSAAWVGGSTLGTVLADIADRTGWSLDDLTYLAANLSPAITYPNDFKDERALVRVARAMDVVGRMGLPAKTVLPWADTQNGDTSTEAAAIKAAVRGTFSAETWPAAVKPVRDALRERQRDAMVSYLVGTSTTFTEPVDLSDDVLMDVEVGSCAKTSRIKQAISSTQTFIQRVFLNFEPSVVFTTDDARKWEWMKAFRLWEANRKIFLYPENWIEPTLRDNKSELFERLETDLSKGELNDDLIEQAIVNYLKGLDEVAQLSPIAAIPEEDAELKRSRFHVVARTKSHPPVNYYRVRETNGRWLGWKKLDFDLQGEHVAMAIYNRRPLIIWGVFEAHAISPGTLKTPQQNPPTKRYDVRVRWTSYEHGKWGKVQQSKRTISDGRPLGPEEEEAIIKAGDVSLRTQFDAVNGDLIVDCTIWTEKVVSVQYKTLTTNWLEHLRLTSCGVVQYAKHSRDLVRTLRPAQPPIVANAYSDVAKQKLALPDVFNFSPEELSKVLVEYVPVLDTTPSDFELMTTSMNDDSWTFDPLFFADGRRTFIVTPSASLSVPTTTASPMAPSAPAPDSTNHVAKVWSNSGPQVTSVLSFTQSPPSGGTTYSLKLLAPSTPIVRPVTHTAFTFSPFHHPFVCDLLTQVHRMGVDRMFDPQPGKVGSDLRRQSKSTAYFAALYAPTKWVTQPYPVDDFDFSLTGAYSLYNWELFFHVPLLIATKLAANQQFEEARKWFHFIFNPTEAKSPTAPPLTEEAPQRFWKIKPFFELSAKETAAEGPVHMLKLLLSHDDSDPARVAARKLIEAQVDEWRENPFEPHRIARLRLVAYMKTTVIKYLDMLIAWGDQLFARSTIESITEALQVYQVAYRVLGKRPVKLPPQSAPVFTYDGIASSLDAFSDALVKIESALPPVNDDTPRSVLDEGPTDERSMVFCVPPNEKLLGYWDTVEDRLYKIRHCLNLQGVAVNLPLFEPPIDPGLLVRARAAGVDIGSLLADLNAPLPFQRYAVLAQRANELVAEVKSLGSAFLSALEKSDAEELALLRSGQEIQVMQAMQVSKAQAVEDTARAREALEKSREAAVARRDYYASRPYRNEDEVEQARVLGLANEVREASQIAQAIAAAMQTIPSFQSGSSGSGLHFVVSLGGSTLAAISSTTASALGIEASRHDVAAQLSGTQATYRRRMDDWQFQRAQAETEIQNLDKQILAAQIREAIAQNDLETQDLQIQNSIDVRDFMRDKFTNVALYDYMVSQLAATYFQAYKLAYDAAKRAERAWKFEIAEETTSPSSFITFGYWDGLRKGLLAGEKLGLDLKRMEMAYLDKNRREFELVRHVPLTMLDPEGLQELREKGFTEIDIPESFFDIDSPGHYLRRLRNVTLTVAATTGEYTPVRCTLTLLENRLRTFEHLDTSALTPNTFPIQSIVTSTGRDDGGLFETNLRDERYLPFEGAGAVSKWRIELPTAVPLFDYRTISDVILHLRYTARDGGASFRTVVNAALTAGISRVVGFSAKSVFSDEWYRFTTGTGAMTLALDTDHVPFKGPSPKITSVELIRVRAPAPGGAAFVLALTPPSAGVSNISLAPVATLGNQHAGSVTYTSGSYKALGNWSLAHSTDLLADDDLYVVITYVTT